MNLLKYVFSSTVRRLACCLAVLSLLPASAWASWSCDATGSPVTLQLPASVAVARDLPVGTMLTNWVSSTNVQKVFTCTSSSTYVGITFWYAGMVPQGTNSVMTAKYNGVDFPVFPTNVAGVGIAMGGFAVANGKGGTVNPFAYFATNNASGTNYGLGGQLTVALVKTGDITPGTVSGGVVSSARVTIGGPSFPSSSGLVSDPPGVDYSITPVVITVLTCQTPDVEIPMGIHGPDLPSVGSLSSNPAAFNISLKNCPGGTAVPGTQVGLINSIQYKIDPSNGTVPGFSNVAALSGNPSAGGVGIQLFDSTGAVFPLGVNQTLSGFNSTAGGNYSIPLTARYYRTGTLTTGPANTTMTVTMTYL